MNSPGPLEIETSPELKLQLSTDPTRDPSRMSVTITVANTSSRPIGWDNRWSALLLWNVTDSDTGAAIPSVRVGEAERPGVSEVRSRFVTIEPSGKLQHKIDLEKRHLQFVSGQSSSESGAGIAHEAIGYEEWVEYRPAATIKSVDLVVEYWIGGGSVAGFTEWFGKFPSELSMSELSARSNGVTIRLDK